MVEARIAQAEGDLDQAIAEFEMAVQIQDSLAYWSRSTGTTRCASRSAPRCSWPGARRRRGGLRQSLIDAPNNGWALYGLMEA